MNGLKSTTSDVDGRFQCGRGPAYTGAMQRDIETAFVPARHRSAPSTALGFRGLLIFTGIFWGCFSLVTLAYGWDAFGGSAATAWRPLLSDTVGAGLSIGMALALSEVRRWGPAARLALAAALALVGVAIYSAVVLVLVGPLMPPPETPDSGTERMLRIMLVHYWVFAAYGGFYLLLDQGRAAPGGVSEEDDAQEWLRARLFGRTEVWDGLNARWFWTFQGVFWTAMVVFSTANLINGGDSISTAWRVVLGEGIGMTASSLAHFLVLKPTRLWPLYRRAALALGVAIILTMIYVCAIWFSYFQVLPGEPPMRNGEPVDTGLPLLLYLAPRWMFLNFPVFVGWIGFYLALDAARRLRSQERQLYNSIMLAQESQLKMLRFQLNPHFLFNTLNAISSLLLDTRANEADKMLTQLSKFLRFTLDAAPDDRVPLRREIDAQRLYLEIEQTRFADRLEIAVDIDPVVEDALVPTMILQPLLENAVKYAVSQTTRAVRVTVEAKALSDDILELRVTDTGSGGVSTRAYSGGGVGLSNIRARLAVLYGDTGRLEAGPQPEGGFAAVITMPLERSRAPKITEREEESDARTSGR